MALRPYYDRANPDLLRSLPPEARLVVEVGCGAAALGAQYKAVNPQVRYVGLEVVEEAAAVARRRLDHVVLGNAEDLDAADCDLVPGTVDCLVYGDVLEHLVDPWALLKRQADWLRLEGVALACIPNVQHWSMFLRLFQGYWRYEDAGLLDRMHLRFFTLDSIEELFTHAGLSIVDVIGRNSVKDPNSFAQFHQLMGPWVRELGLDAARFAQQTAALQYVIRAVKPAPSSLRLSSLCGLQETMADR
jgi:SAM-dependent methyltransferase